eukprot:Phypoly_transcript_04565.p1 GENE.Phypoly_transcript_04565~~Phypoly_transcript_04565.p1  ORF type:complete len:496 (-),score=67.89 Phypoly_transcript_04565:632-2119(-)
MHATPQLALLAVTLSIAFAIAACIAPPHYESSIVQAHANTRKHEARARAAVAFYEQQLGENIHQRATPERSTILAHETQRHTGRKHGDHARSAVSFYKSQLSESAREKRSLHEEPDLAVTRESRTREVRGTHDTLETQARAPLATGKLVNNVVAMYPRAIVLAHQPNASNNGLILVDFTSFTPAAIGAIYASANNGTSFVQVGSVNDPGAANGLCCTVIFELPSQVGNMPAGTILWAGSIGQAPANRRMSINLWQSPDLGHSWKFVSSPAVAANAGGLWEPELNIDIDGQLVCHFSDETLQPTYSQLLQEVFSKDGITWSQRFPTVALTDAALRPGMANVRQLSPSLWIMTYEICGQRSIYNCAATYRTSPNGQNWGPPTDVGILVADSLKRYYIHAPTMAFSPQTGVLVVGGQILIDANGDVDSGSGATLFQSDVSLGGWKPIPSPVVVPDTKDDVCPNYSSALVFMDEGSRLLEVATDYNGNTCMAYYAIQNL